MPVAGCRRRSHGVGVRGALASPYFNRSDTISVATCCRNALHLAGHADPPRAAQPVSGSLE